MKRERVCVWGLDWFELLVVGAQEERVASDPSRDWGLGFPPSERDEARVREMMRELESCMPFK